MSHDTLSTKLTEARTLLKSATMTEKLYQLGVLLSLILLCAVMSVMSSRFLTIDNLMNVASQAAVSAIVSIGMFLAILTAGIDLSVGSVLALSTMMMGIASDRWGLNPYLSILVCLGSGSLLGLANGLLLTKLRLPPPVHLDARHAEDGERHRSGRHGGGADQHVSR